METQKCVDLKIIIGPFSDGDPHTPRFFDACSATKIWSRPWSATNHQTLGFSLSNIPFQSRGQKEIFLATLITVFNAYLLIGIIADIKSRINTVVTLVLTFEYQIIMLA